MDIGWLSPHYEQPWLWRNRNREGLADLGGSQRCHHPSWDLENIPLWAWHAQVWIEVLSWWSLWSRPEVATFHCSDGPFEEAMCLKLERHNSRFSCKRKKKLDCFSLPRPGDPRRKRTCQTWLGAARLAAWLGQATRSKAKRRIEDSTKFSGRCLGDLVFWEALSVSGIRMSWRGRISHDKRRCCQQGVSLQEEYTRRSLEGHPSYQQTLP